MMHVLTSGIGRELAQKMERQAPMAPSPAEIAYNNKDEILAITGTFFAVAASIVLLRVYVRMFMLKVFGIDDWVMLFAMALATGTFVCFVIETHYGLGRHFILIMSDPALYSKFSMMLYIHALIIMVAVSSVKISIAFSLLRLLTRTRYTRFIYAVMIFIVCMTLGCAGSLIFQCIPIKATWDLSLRPPPSGTGNAKCYSITIFRNLGLMNSSFNIVTDVLFATLPIPVFWGLQLNTRTRASLIGVFSLGYFACAAAITKAVQQWNVLTDPDWTSHDSFNIWNYIELTVGIMAASLPTLKPLFNSFLEAAKAMSSGIKSKGSGYRSSGYKGSGGYYKTSGNSSKSIALQSLTSKGDSTPKQPYNVRVTTNAHANGQRNTWDMKPNGSQESILPLQQPEAGTNRIVLTREVTVA